MYTVDDPRAFDWPSVGEKQTECDECGAFGPLAGLVEVPLNGYRALLCRGCLYGSGDPGPVVSAVACGTCAVNDCRDACGCPVDEDGLHQHGPGEGRRCLWYPAEGARALMCDGFDGVPCGDLAVAERVEDGCVLCADCLKTGLARVAAGEPRGVRQSVTPSGVAGSTPAPSLGLNPEAHSAAA